MRVQLRLVALLSLLLPGVVWAHHGSGISYDVAHLWTTWATVAEFNYKNPHPTMTWDRKLKDGTGEHWTTELLTAPAPLVRAGWTRGRSEEALKPGTRVKVYVGTARAGGTSGIVMRVENEKGEELLSGMGRPAPQAVDMEGVPMGLQPTGNDKLPGASPSGDR